MTTKVKPPAAHTAKASLKANLAPFSKTPPKKKRSPQGRPLVLTMLLSPRFRRSLAAAMEAVRVDKAELGVVSDAQLRKAIVEAYRRLGKENVTATDWVGRVFEIIGPLLPEVKLWEDIALAELIELVNAQLTSHAKGLHFTNGYGAATTVKSGFGKGDVIVSVRIRRPGRPKGSDYVDRGHLRRNKEGLLLFVSVEYKTRGAAGELKPQTTQRDARLVDDNHPPGTQLVYEIEGRPGEQKVDLAHVILVTGSKSPALRDAGLFSRIGVRAGKRFKVAPALDDHGEPYIRIVAPVATDPLRKILEKLLRDRTWQR